MNYFEWLGIEPTAQIDTALLRRNYLQRSRDFHPDFHTLQSNEAQQKALENSTYTNLAYQTLLQPISRLRYLLEMGGYHQESAKLPADFLMEMMELNETKAELELEPDATRQAHFLATIEQHKSQLESDFAALLQTFNALSATPNDWLQLRDYYQRLLYLSKLG